jgi:hypothetical protein
VLAPALLVAPLLVAPVRLESALAGAEAPDDAAVVPVPNAVDDSPEVDEVDCIGCANPCRVCGTVDNDDERCPERCPDTDDATVCTCVPADIPVACATAAA